MNIVSAAPYPSFHPLVHRTPKGVPYLQESGVAIIAMSIPNFASIQQFLDSFDSDLGFSPYLDDPTPIAPMEALCKFAGQLCYLSLGEKRSKNDKTSEYFDHIKSSGHGSVLEHANVTILLYGISRTLTHELVRHRAGFGFSQVSQRYVDGSKLRFVERPEYVNHPRLHPRFVERIERAAKEYEETATCLAQDQLAGMDFMQGERKTDLRKKVQQCARSVLTNETEAPIVVTANLRGWRHFCEMRASMAAEIEIRSTAVKIFRCLREIAPVIFSDYQEETLTDTTLGLSTTFRKV